MAIDDAVFRRSIILVIGGNGGELIASFPDVFRDSHEKGLVSFLLGGAGVGSFEEAGGGGGADQGTDGSEPESPISVALRGFLGGSAGAFFSSSIIRASWLAFYPITISVISWITIEVPFVIIV